MDGAQVPLISSIDLEPGYAKNKFTSVSLIKWMLKILMWAIFLAWATVIFIYPSEFVQQLFVQWITDTSGTPFGVTGSTFLMFSIPILIIAFLSVAYIIVSSTEDLNKKKNPKSLKSRLWTFPVLVDGPFGVVSAAELIGILIFAIYTVWSIYAYAVQNYNSLSTYDLPSRAKSYLMMELMGLSFGAIGQFLLAFLFLPIARGSLLLRLIDIPFEHATRYHVWLGHLTMLIFTLHGGCYLLAWALEHRLVQSVLQWQNVGIANLPGVISLSAGLLMWVTSFHSVRKQYFELFFYTHQLYVVFIVFFALHVGDFIFCTIAGGLFLFLLDRFLRFCQSRRTVNVVSAKSLPCGTVELVLSKPKNLRYNALSFIFVHVRELSWLQWHPFSVSSSPLDSRSHLSVLIKVLGDWTKNLRDNISSSPEEPYSRITASVEGPYGHESPYHLMYENLILVAGGIGISPFLAILRDILHHINERKPCITKKILVIWAVKKSTELALLCASDLEAICPFFSDKLHLEIQTYVTQESDPPLEDGEVGKSMQQSYYFLNDERATMSGLVGTGNNIWCAIYVILPTISFIIFLALLDVFYIKPFGIISWWFKALLLMACMVASVVIVGGLVVVCWDLWERRDSTHDGCMDDDDKISEPVQDNEPMLDTTATRGILASLITTQYGRRPDFPEIFHSIYERWGHVDVGVIVCGPPTLESCVAKECRMQNIRHRSNQPFFHFNSHSFEL